MALSNEAVKLNSNSDSSIDQFYTPSYDELSYAFNE